ncbi:acyl carrier protein [Gehongia tenuis]|uniref:Acyl carrier protein n=1 Tax=Gehongia tenuis TaxID=2763655 RepID=A0A926HNU2_9FIRM|nr:acyl carrier protein [Gehongia tenuis]MBC8530974.1 acyl carrier protein [Gehongia tenuis]
MVFEKVQSIVADKFSMDPSEVTLESEIEKDLKADSIDMADLIMDLEDAFDMQIEEDKLAEIKTVGDIVRYIEDNQ